MGHYCVSDHVILRNFKSILWLLKASCLLVNWSLCKRNSSIIWNEKQIKNLEKTIFRKKQNIVEECVLTKSPCDILPYFFLLFLIFYECIEKKRLVFQFFDSIDGQWHFIPFEPFIRFHDCTKGAAKSSGTTSCDEIQGVPCENVDGQS